MTKSALPGRRKRFAVVMRRVPARWRRFLEMLRPRRSFTEPSPPQLFNRGDALFKTQASHVLAVEFFDLLEAVGRA